MSKLITGEHNDTDEGKIGRWCDPCNRYHGDLYVCPKYPRSVKNKLRKMGDQFRANLADPAWCQRQIDSGLPPEGIIIFRIMSGVPDPEEPA